MVLLSFLTVLLTASSSSPPAPAAPPALLLVLDVDAEHLPAVDRDGLGEALALALARRLDLDVQSMRSLSVRAQLGAEQQAVGCDDSSCLAEIANAMGARYVSFSRVVRLGDQQLLRVDIFDSVSGRTVAMSSKQGQLSSLFSSTNEVVDTLVREAAGALPLRTVAPPPPGRGIDVGKVVVGSVGVVGVVGGVVLLAVGVGQIDDFNTATAKWNRTPSIDNAEELKLTRDHARNAPAFLGAGAGLAVVGLAVAGTAIVLLFADGGGP